MIPRATKHNQRRCGGSLRCNTNSSTITNFGRSNSFRVHRPITNFCKHTKYCCLHQRQQYPHNVIDFGYDSAASGENDHMEVTKVKTSRAPLLDRTFECGEYRFCDRMLGTGYCKLSVPVVLNMPKIGVPLKRH